MKKKLLITSLAIYSVAINAQITITSADMPVAGNTYYTASDDSVTSYGSAGANQIWDFSSWGNTSMDTSSYQSPSGVPGASYFPTSNLVIVDTVNGSNFLQVSSTGALILGGYYDFGGNGTPSPIIYNPSQPLIMFPATYQSVYSGTTNYSVAIPVNNSNFYDSARFDVQVVYNSVIDGSGTITTPSYSNVNALRQFNTQVAYTDYYVMATDSSTWTYSGSDTSTNYSYVWWSNDYSHTVAEVYFDINDTVYSASYLTGTLVGVNELAEKTNAVSVFPSPATDKLNFIGIDANSYLMIFDVNGKIVDKLFVKKNTTVNVSNYNNGIYFYTVAPINGSAVSQGKFVVQK